MEEIKEESCSTSSKKCCTKGIIILIVCCLISFFIGFYSGSKSTSRKFNRRPTVSRPFSPSTQKLPSNIPNIQKTPNIPPKIQPPIIQRKNQPNIPNIPNTQVNTSQNVQKAETPTTGQAKSKTNKK